MPARIFPSVLLPAPFSPQSAWQVPAAMEKVTSSRARTPGKRLVTRSKLTAGFMNGAVASRRCPAVRKEVPDTGTDHWKRSGHFQEFFPHVGESPGLELTRPSAEVVLGHAH